MSYYVYILKLRHNKYYVGRTKDIRARLTDHNTGRGSEWTKIHKPIDIVDIITKCDAYDEDKYTLKYIEMYGIDNVRGGSFSSPVLSKTSKEAIKLMIRGANDRCFNCGSNGHFSVTCLAYNI
jgi:hypothetical protein